MPLLGYSVGRQPVHLTQEEESVKVLLGDEAGASLLQAFSIGGGDSGSRPRSSRRRL